MKAPLRTYGDHIRARRLDLGLLQEQVAEQIGVDETSIYNWENNRDEPAVRLIPRIIRFLHRTSRGLISRQAGA